MTGAGRHLFHAKKIKPTKIPTGESNASDDLRIDRGSCRHGRSARDGLRLHRLARQPVYVAPVAAYAGCNPCGGWVRERLPDPEQQYYYVNQGPTYTGPGNWAPRPVYREGSISGYGYGYNRPYRHRAHRYYHRHHHGYAARYYHGQRVLRRYY